MAHVARQPLAFPQRLSLSFKLLCLVIGVSFIGVSLSSLLLLTFQREQAIENAETAITRLSTAIEAGIEHAVVEKDWAMVNQVVDAVKAKNSVEGIRILDANGIVRSSWNHAEVGADYGQADPHCNFCHGHSGGTSPANKTTVLSQSTRQDVLLNVNLIYTPVDCLGCSPPTSKVEGILMIEVPLTSLNDQLAAGLWRVGLSAVVSFALLVGLMLPAMRRLISRPIVELTRAASELGSGNLDIPVHVASRDEFGELGDAFDAMREQLKMSRVRIERDRQEAIILYQLGMQITASLDLELVVNAVADGARQMLAADIGLVGLMHQEHREIVVQATSGNRTDALKHLRVPLRKGAPTGFLSSEEPLIIESYDGNGSAPHSMEFIRAEGIVSVLSVPLRRGERLLGLVMVMTRQPRHFTSEESQMLARLAHFVVVAIENAQLYRQVRYLAVLEERDRLGRELHDDLAQALGYIKLKSSIVDDLVQRGEIEQSRAGILELKQVASQAYTNVREAIFSLRTIVSSELGLVPVLQDYLAEYKSHYGLDASLLVDSDFPTTLSTEVMIQVIRVIQEALTNARKHAQASQVRVRFERMDGTGRIIVQDNGRGFDPNTPRENGGQHCGLGIMRERMQGVGGTLDIDTTLGKGTRIIMNLPALDGSRA